MADNYETMNQESPNYGCFKEAVCIDASRVYDSCGDKDCLEDLRVYFSPASQAVIDQAAQVRMRNVDVLVVYLGLEPVPFHKGFYSVDMTFFFEVTLDVFQTPAAPPRSLFRPRRSLHDRVRRRRVPEKGHSVRQRRQRQGIQLRRLSG